MRYANSYPHLQIAAASLLLSIPSRRAEAQVEISPDWRAIHEAAGGGDDTANAIVTDAQGNFYVTGLDSSNGGYPWDESRPEDSGDDFATVKYSPEGEPLWVARYDGGGYDTAAAIAVDAKGNVYVTGSSIGWIPGPRPTPGPRDIVTIKYDSAGRELWLKRAGLNVGDMGQADAIRLDSLGNVYVRATSIDRFNWPSSAYISIKYDGDGNEAWRKFYYPGRGNEHRGRGLAVDAGGNVFIAGGDVVKYDSSGTQLWARSVGNRGGAVAVDGLGNAYVSAFVFSGSNSISTTKYNSSGAVVWSRLYTGAGSTAQGQTTIALDADGNVHVAGALVGAFFPDSIVIKYDSGGGELWARRRDSSSYPVMTVGSDGSTYLAATAVSGGPVTVADAYLTLKIDAGGNVLWERMYDDINEAFSSFEISDGPRAIAVRGDGRVYATGRALSDYVTLSYDAAGGAPAVTRYDGPEGGHDVASAVAAGADGHLYVTGAVAVSGGTRQATIKLDAAGQQLWAATYNAPDSVMDGGIDVAVDESGNIYVAGNAGAPDGSRDYSLVKYDSEGRLVWAAAYDGGWDDAASDLAIDSEGSAYITGGAAIDSRGIVRDCATAKYDVGGQLVWAARHSSGACNALAVDGSGSVYATGETATIKYDAGGHELWMAPFDYGAAIVVDPRGGVYVTGGFGTFITAHYTASGGETWRRDSPWTGFAQALVIDSANRVVVAGFAGDFESFGTTIVKYDVDGTEMWVGGSVGEGATSLAIDADDSTRVTSLWGEVAKHDAAGTPLWVGLPGVRASTTNKAVAVDSMGRTYVTSSLSETFGLRSSIWTASYSGASFVRGDANDDGRVDISDAVFTLGSLFLGDGDPRCDDACDSNDDGTVDISDAIATLVVLFLGNGVIPLPGMTECGVDPTDDVLACDSFEGCP